MSNFFANIYKNLILVYLLALGCFAYSSMLAAIPDHVYVKEGESLSLDALLPVSLAFTDEEEVMADVGESTYAIIRQRNSGTVREGLEMGEHEAMCYLFGVLPVKEVEVSVVREQSLYASGRVVGIYGATQGVLVIGEGAVETADGGRKVPAENLVFAGDYITAVNGEPIREKEDLIRMVDTYGQEPMVLTLWRGEELIDVSVQAARVSADAYDSRYMLGLWVKDDMAGIGTLTYYDESGNFGALGHGIGDGETGALLRIREGELYESRIMGIVKGKRGAPGELQGMVYYGKSNQLGAVESNTEIGIYGCLDEERCEAYRQEDILCPVGYKQDVTTGDAVILSDVSGESATYHIRIDSLDFSPNDKNKGIRFHVDDPELLALTGGIVQGLSGSPILQDGQLVGAVTHVLVNEPTQGYGIFIEGMLEKRE